MKKVSKILFLASIIFMGSMTIINAETVTLKNPLKPEYGTFSQLVAGVTETAVSVLIPFVVIGFIYSGFLFVKAQGKEKELEEAKKAIYYSVIGAFILLGASVFAGIIGRTVTSITGIN